MGSQRVGHDLRLNNNQPGDSPGENTRVGHHSLFQGIFLSQRSNEGLLHCRQILYLLNYQESLTTICFRIPLAFVHEN